MGTLHPATHAPGARRLFLAGVLLVLLGPALYLAQMRWLDLWTPWYVPALATLGLLLMALSVRRHGVVWKKIVLVLCLALCIYEWFFVAYASRTGPYTGPAQPGRQVPAFAAARPDGTPFTSTDLESGSPTVLVFYRGHW
jgi:hypothetical protein